MQISRKREFTGNAKMNKVFEVSFNSPQCGWMSIGFEHANGEFHTTTAHAPYTNALAEILNIVAGLVSAKGDFSKTLKWNRDPEEYDFVFASGGGDVSVQITEYPTADRENGEIVYSYSGTALEVAAAFEQTFQQMYDERDIDEFEENWHQKFPIAEFESLKTAIRESR